MLVIIKQTLFSNLYCICKHILVSLEIYNNLFVIKIVKVNFSTRIATIS